jgi:hypothetical protein
MRLYLNKAEAEELLQALQPHTDNPVLKALIEYLQNRKDLPPLKK